MKSQTLHSYNIIVNDFGGINFDDLFSQFFTRGGNKEFHFSNGGQRAGYNFKQNFNKKKFYDEYDNKNYFKNTDIINIKIFQKL